MAGEVIMFDEVLAGVKWSLGATNFGLPSALPVLHQRQKHLEQR